MNRHILNLAVGTALTLTMASASLASKAKSEFEPQDDRPTKKMRLDIKQETQETKAALFSRYSDFLDKIPKTQETGQTLIAGYFDFQTLFSFEWTSNANHVAFQDAPQYRALIKGWEDQVPFAMKTSKQKLLYLNAAVPEFKVYLADLWYNFFPLEGPMLKLDHYGSMPKEVPKFTTHLNRMYDSYLKLSSQQAEVKNWATLGRAITQPKDDKAHPGQTNYKTNYKRLETFDSIYRDDTYSPDQRNIARFYWIEQSVKHSLVEPSTPPLPYTATKAREDYQELFDKLHDTLPHIKMSVLYHIGELDYLGHGLEKPNKKDAKDKFLEVLDNPKSHPFTRGLANKYLARILSTND
jgi:hypothetical protein